MAARSASVRCVRSLRTGTVVSETTPPPPLNDVDGATPPSSARSKTPPAGRWGASEVATPASSNMSPASTPNGWDAPEGWVETSVAALSSPASSWAS
eukprot:8170893-Pyramimonas_sp.AAC.1